VLKLVEDLLAEKGVVDHGTIDHAILARSGQDLITISALELVIKDLEEGNEPTPKEIGNKLGVAAQSVSMCLGRLGIYTDKIDNRNVYKKETIEQIKSDLKKLREREPERPSSSTLSL
jgi:predicted transcriptional regulator